MLFLWAAPRPGLSHQGDPAQLAQSSEQECMPPIVMRALSDPVLGEQAMTGRKQEEAPWQGCPGGCPLPSVLWRWKVAGDSPFWASLLGSLCSFLLVGTKPIPVKLARGLCAQNRLVSAITQSFPALSSQGMWGRNS